MGGTDIKGETFDLSLVLQQSEEVKVTSSSRAASGIVEDGGIRLADTISGLQDEMGFDYQRNVSRDQMEGWFRADGTDGVVDVL